MTSPRRLGDLTGLIQTAQSHFDGARPDQRHLQHEVCACLLYFESMALGCFNGHAPKAFTVLVTIKNWTNKEGDPGKHKRDELVHAVLKSQPNRAAHAHSIEVRIKDIGRDAEPRHDVCSHAHLFIAHQWQIDQALDRAVAEIAQQRFVLFLNFCWCGTLGQCQTKHTKAFECGPNCFFGFPNHELENDSQAIGFRPIDLPPAFDQHLFDVEFGLFKIRAEERTIGKFEAQS
ncbi:hypothetical protein V1281_005429 [Nitrobacteraceae bacterium AZCC 2161]